jgi:hypothetical protein
MYGSLNATVLQLRKNKNNEPEPAIDCRYLTLASCRGHLTVTATCPQHHSSLGSNGSREPVQLSHCDESMPAAALEDNPVFMNCCMLYVRHLLFVDCHVVLR